MTVKPWPQLLGAHSVDARGTGFLLDASERLSEIPTGQTQLPQAHLGGVRSGIARRRRWAALCTKVFGLHRRTLPPRPLAGLAAINAHPASTSVLRLGFAFGPSQRYRSPLVIRPLLTSPRRVNASRRQPSRTTPRTKWTGHLGHPWRPPRIRPATVIAHPPRLRTGPLMDIGLRLVGADSPGPTRLIRAACRAQTAGPADHVFLGSRLRTPASFPPSLATEQLPSACGWCHQPPQGTRTPELLIMSCVLPACGTTALGSCLGW